MPLQSSYKGQIKRLFMVATDQTHEIIGALCTSLHQNTQLVVYADSHNDTENILGLLEALSIRFAIYNSSQDQSSYRCLVIPQGSQHFVIWVRDPFLVANIDGSVVAMQTHLPVQPMVIGSTKKSFSINPVAMLLTVEVKPENLRLAEYLQELRLIDGLAFPTAHPKAPINTFWYGINAGNVLVGDDYVLIGRKEYVNIINNLHLMDNKDIGVLGELIFEYINIDASQRQIIFLGDSWSCHSRYPDGPKKMFDVDFPSKSLIHLDLFITQTGIAHEGKEVLLVGQAVTEDDEVIYGIEMGMCLIIQQLEAVTNKDGSRKFHIIRNPIPTVYKDDGYYFFAYNNCLVEVYMEAEKTVRSVWLPEFSFIENSVGSRKYFDEKIQDIWESLGFNVLFVKGDFHALCEDLGALHCITNEIRSN